MEMSDKNGVKRPLDRVKRFCIGRFTPGFPQHLVLVRKTDLSTSDGCRAPSGCQRLDLIKGVRKE